MSIDTIQEPAECPCGQYLPWYALANPSGAGKYIHICSCERAYVPFEPGVAKYVGQQENPLVRPLPIIPELEASEREAIREAISSQRPGDRLVVKSGDYRITVGVPSAGESEEVP